MSHLETVYDLGQGGLVCQSANAPDLYALGGHTPCEGRVHIWLFASCCRRGEARFPVVLGVVT